MTVSIMITTRDRINDLRRTLEKVFQLSPPPLEVIVTADGCIDGTVKMIRERFPRVQLRINEIGQGSVASRDAMLRSARGDLVLALDDDSYPEQSDCLGLLVELFQKSPKLAVAHFPQRSDEYPATLTQTDFGKPRFTNSFPNSGACYRRSIYLQLPGFYAPFFHMYEEPDYALQCLAAGWDVLYHPLVTIRHHFTGAMRNEMRNHMRHARNEWWSILLRCPWWLAPLFLIYRPFSQMRYAFRRGCSWIVREPIWWGWAIGGIPACLRHRRAVSARGYWRWVIPESRALRE